MKQDFWHKLERVIDLMNCGGDLCDVLYMEVHLDRNSFFLSIHILVPLASLKCKFNLLSLQLMVSL